MSGASAPPEKQKTRAYWADRAQFWNDNADRIADMADRLNQPLLDAANIAQGQKVLDLASGAGEPALSAGHRVGPSGHVTATDLVPAMLEGAKRRAAAAGLSHIAFELADMERMPFDDANFDRVICRFGIMFTTNVDAALGETFRVLRPGGRAAFLVWGPRDNSTQFRVFKAASEAVFGDVPDLDMETPFRFGAEGSLAGPMQKAGFVDVEERELRFAPKVPTGAPFWAAQVEMTFGPVLAKATDAQKAAFDVALVEGFAATIKDDAYHLALHARIGVGKVPD